MTDTPSAAMYEERIRLLEDELGLLRIAASPTPGCDCHTCAVIRGLSSRLLRAQIEDGGK